MPDVPATLYLEMAAFPGDKRPNGPLAGYAAQSAVLTYDAEMVRYTGSSADLDWTITLIGTDPDSYSGQGFDKGTGFYLLDIVASLDPLADVAIPEVGETLDELAVFGDADHSAALTLRAPVPADPVSVKERIERVIKLLVEGVRDIGEVYRWDQRGLLDPTTHLPRDTGGAWTAMAGGDCLVAADDESADEGGEGGDSATTQKTFKVELQLKILQAESGTGDVLKSTAELHNRWIYRLEKAITANPRMIEPTDVGNEEQLAIDTRVTRTQPARPGGEQREAMALIEFDIVYDHFRTDPAAGPGITHFSDPDEE